MARVAYSYMGEFMQCNANMGELALSNIGKYSFVNKMLYK